VLHNGTIEAAGLSSSTSILIFRDITFTNTAVSLFQYGSKVLFGECDFQNTAALQFLNTDVKIGNSSGSGPFALLGASHMFITNSTAYTGTITKGNEANVIVDDRAAHTYDTFVRK
jgi:hypothetical protein